MISAETTSGNQGTVFDEFRKAEEEMKAMDQACQSLEAESSKWLKNYGSYLCYYTTQLLPHLAALRTIAPPSLTRFNSRSAPWFSFTDIF
jgi:hypothetical protein